MLRSRRFYIDVPVEISEVIADISTDELLEELQARKRVPDEVVHTVEEMKAVRTAILENRIADAASMLERMIWPKWKNIAACENQYKFTKPDKK